MVYGGCKPFQSARSATVTRCARASEYSVSPRLTSTDSPGRGWDTGVEPAADGLRTTVLLPQAASNSTARARIARRSTMLAGLVALLMRMRVSCMGPSGCRGMRSTGQLLEDAVRGRAAAANQHRKVDHGADIGCVAQQYGAPVALDHADRVQQQRQRREGVAERHEAEGRHQ